MYAYIITVTVKIVKAAVCSNTLTNYLTQKTVKKLMYTNLDKFILLC